MNSPTSRLLPFQARSSGRALVPVAVLLWMAAGGGCADKPRFTDSMDPDSVFTAHVIPLLERSCEGCHFSGGEMYSSMPFDLEATLLRLQGEMLTRMEGKDRDRLAEWYAWRTGRSDPK